MRRRIGTCLLAVAMLAAVMVPALAAAPTGDKPGMYDLTVEAGYTVTPMKADNTDAVAADGFYADAVKLKVVVNDAKATSFYLVTAQNAADVPKEENLVYIDQQNGASATFNVYPSSMEDGKPYYIFIASNDSDGALKQIASFTYYGGKAAGILGDVDGSGEVDYEDAILILQYDAGYDVPELEGEGFQVGDVDGNGDVDYEDAILILQYDAGYDVPELA